MKTIRPSISILFLLALLVVPVSAAPVGSIKGYVRDSSGASIPKANLTLTNEKTGVQEKTVSDSTGLYQFLDINPGSYQVTVEVPGFRTTDVKGVIVLVDQIVGLDLKLELGNVTQAVEVSGSQELLQTENSSTGTNITAEMTSSLPLANRQFTDLAVLTPGASFAAPGSQAGAFAVAGSRSQSTNWQIDGVNAIDPNVNGPTNSYRIADAIQELSVATTAYSAAFGRASGGEVSVVTKSGGNTFHGGVFEFDRNDALDASSFFTNALNGTKPVLRYNQFGGTLGGPIKRNKTFFFYSFERLDEINPAATTAVVPTLAQRASIVDPISANLVAFYPLPTLPSAAAGTTNFVGNVPNVTKDNTNFIRIDHTISNADRLSGHYINYFGTVAAGGTLPSTGGSTNTPGQQNAEVSEVHTFSPTFLSEIRLGYSRNKTHFDTQDATLNAQTVLPGVPGVVDALTNPQDAGIPTVTIAGGYATLGTATNLPQGRRSNTYEIYSDSTKIATLGSTTHTIKFGWYGRREETWRYLDGTSRGSLSFSNFADFAGNCATCGNEAQINSSTIHTGDTLGHWYRYPNAFYVQDDIKVRPNLTVSVGLRYEMPSVLTEKRDKGTNFIPGVGPVLLGTDEVLGVNTALVGPSSLTLTPGPVKLSGAGVKPDYTDVGPTIGAAWTTHDGKTVVRGGFRIGYDDLFNNIPINQTSNAPWSLTTTQTAGVTQPGTYSWNLAFNQNVPLVSTTPGGTHVGLVSFNAEAENAKQAYSENYNVSVQREITKGSTIEVSYIGTSGHRLGLELDQNQPNVIVNNPAVRGSLAPNVQIFPYPTWASVDGAVFDGKSNYNGLVISGKVHLTQHLSMNSSYTWSHSIDDTSSFLGTTFDSENPASSNVPLILQRGNSAFDQRQRFINAFVYDLPFKAANGIVNEAISGWTLSGITNLATGQPFTVLTNPSLDYSGFNQFLDRPNYTCSGPLAMNEGERTHLFNTACFTPAYAGVIGTTPRNAFYGPGLIDFDASVAKRFRITERVGFQFRADFFNALNHTNFALASGNRTESSGTFGQISSTAGLSGGNNGGPRVIQLTGRLIF
jgi:Carboxypeptidase regulatory-like domain/TonB-dependent Receptor Plug Domain